MSGCVHCGASLFGRRGDAIYCSRTCKDLGRHSRGAQTERRRAADRERNRRWRSANRERDLARKASTDAERERYRVRYWGDPVIAAAAYLVHQLKKEASNYGNR